MDRLLEELSQLRLGETLLTKSQIEQIDQATFQYGSSYKHAFCLRTSYVWNIISEVQLFWENLSLLLWESKHNETKLQALILIHNRVRRNWSNENMKNKGNLKTLMGSTLVKFNGGSLTPNQKSLFRKINEIITEIFKYEWAGDCNNFIPEICKTTCENAVLAQNYFHLLNTIFSEIFAENAKLITSAEKKMLHESIIPHEIIIHKICQQYLEYDKHENSALLINLLGALHNILGWISVYYIYHGFILDKLVVYSGIKQYSVMALSCLEVVFELKEENTEISINKIKMKKMQIISSAIRRTKDLMEKCQFIDQKLIHIIYLFFGSHPKEQKIEIKEEQFYKEILLWLIDNFRKDSELQYKIHQNEELIQIAYQVIDVCHPQQIPKIIQLIVHLAPCPQKFSSFYYSEKCLTSKNSSDNQTQKLYEKLLMKASKLLNQTVFQGQLSPFIPTNVQEMESLCHLGWFFYYLNKLDNPIKERNTDFKFIKKCLLLQTSINSILNEKIRNNDIYDLSISLYPQTLVCLRSIVLMCLCKKDISSNKQNKQFLVHFIDLNFKESKNLIQFSFIILQEALMYLQNNQISEVIGFFSEKIWQHGQKPDIISIISGFSACPSLQGNIEVYIQLSSKLVANEKKALHELLKKEMTWLAQIKSQNTEEIKVFYKNNGEYFNSLVEISTYIMKVLITLLPQLKMAIVKKFQEQIQIFSLLNNFFYEVKNFHFVQSYMKMHMKILEFLPEVTEKSIHEFFALYKESQLKDPFLKYFSTFILHHCNEVQWMNLIITNVYQHLNLLIDQHVDFLESVVQSKGFLCLPPQLINKTLSFIFNPPSNFITSSALLKLLNNIQKQMQSNNFLKIWSCFLDLVQQTFRLIFKNLSEEDSHPKFCQILHIQVKILKKSNLYLFQGQRNDEEMCLRIVKYFEEEFGKWKPELLEKLQIELNAIFKGEEETERKILDLLIILQRGF